MALSVIQYEKRKKEREIIDLSILKRRQRERSLVNYKVKLNIDMQESNFLQAYRILRDRSDHQHGF